MGLRTSPVVIGINAAHDASACVLIDGVIVAAMSEERLSRKKHHEGFPWLALDYCLAAADRPDIQSVDCIVLNEYAQTDFTSELRLRRNVSGIITNPSHHLLHAYYAWAASGRDDSAILVVDGSGYSFGEHARRGSPLLGPHPPHAEMEEAESTYAVRGGAIELVTKRWGLWAASQPFYRFPSLGHMFSMASQYIFGHFNHAGKTMGLAPYGDPHAFPDPIVIYGPDGLEIDTEWILRLPPRSTLPAELDHTCCDVAAKVQAELEEAMLYLTRDLHSRTGLPHLCLSGGVALNSVANGRILREGPFAEVFVTPAANDSGIAIGAAVYGHHRLTGAVPSWHHYRDCHGRPYRNADILQALAARRSLVGYTTPDDAALAAANDLASGLVVGWFEGASEFGPRALGRRSILADPRGSAMRDHLNASVKYREPFRPYAASVLEERAADHFDLGWRDPFMLTVANVKDDSREQIASVCHVDGTCRVQTIESNDNGLYRRLIESFHTITGMPMILNTSFNVRGEPIVETPDDAVRCFLSCNMDVLYLDRTRVTKISFAAADDKDSLVPCVSDDICLVAHTQRLTDAWASTQYVVTTRTGYHLPITSVQAEILRLIDGRRTVSTLSNALPDLDHLLLLRSLETLQAKGIVSFARSES